MYPTAGPPGDAVAHFRQAHAREPGNPVLLRLLGGALIAAGQPAEAVIEYERALALTGYLAGLHRSEAERLARAGQQDGATQVRARLAALEMEMTVLLLLRGEALEQLARWDDMIVNHQKLVALRPEAENFHRLGHAFWLSGRHADALAAHEQSLTAKPDYAQGHINRGVALIALTRFDEAVTALDAGLALTDDPALRAATLVNRGTALASLKQFDAALTSFDQAIALAPGSADAFDGRAFLLTNLSRFAEALADYDRALALEGARPFSRIAFNKATTLLAMGRLEEGWPLFERRLVKATGAHWRRLETLRPQWTGDEPLTGKRLFLYEEQGIGDTIQFARYALMAEQAGAQVTLAVAPKLKPLLVRLSPTIRLIDDGQPFDDCDLHCPLPSLPLAFRTRLETIPDGTPYLAAPPEKVATWKDRLGKLPGLKVGLAWAGDPKHARDWDRSVPLATLAPLLGVESVSFVSLQFGPRAADAKDYPQILDLSQELPRLDDLAACMEALDLVITVDSAPAHLAGALARPAWVLVAACADWRWLLERADTPWYPSLRLFRQAQGESWPDVVTRMVNALHEKVTRPCPSAPD